ncbi:MAG: rhodanese-like domain-containing protein [Erysipelothrix sp.]|jgi:rhodanese-related sulfurtransferase|nr:rhodanese-like domain-containing protein [Erysipelothrix sp.]
MKKLIIIIASLLALAACAPSDAQLIEKGWVFQPTENGFVEYAELPAPVDTEKTYKPSADAEPVACKEGVYSSDCSSINKDNLIDFMGRNDVFYIDVRDFNNYAEKHIRGFEVLPYFGLIFNADAPTDPTKVQLFGGTPAAPVATYKESAALLKVMFPQDRPLFIMCQSGARVNWLMQILAANGYDMSKVYNVGGMAQYTDSKYAPFIADTAEFKIQVTYGIEGLTRNN